MMQVREELHYRLNAAKGVIVYLSLQYWLEQRSTSFNTTPNAVVYQICKSNRICVHIIAPATCINVLYQNKKRGFDWYN